MRCAAIVQARMGSTRLPGKVMKMLSGKTVLAHVVERLSACTCLDQIVIATTNLPQDDIIEKETLDCGAAIYRGSEADVLDRYYQAAVKFGVDIVVRITSDCPLIDPLLLTAMIKQYQRLNSSDQAVDYLSNTQIRRYPRGLDIEIFSFSVLKEAACSADEAYQHEHVTPYIYMQPEKYQLEDYMAEQDFSDLRWTLDTQEDFLFLQEVYKELYKPEEVLFSTQDVLGLMQQRPELKAINAMVHQKDLTNEWINE